MQNTLVETERGKVVRWKRHYLRGLDGRILHVRSPHSALNLLLQSAGAIICKQWIVLTEQMLYEQGLRHGWDGDYAFMAWVHKALCTIINQVNSVKPLWGNTELSHREETYAW